MSERAIGRGPCGRERASERGGVGTLRAAAAAAASSCRTSPTPVAGAARGTLGNALAAAPTPGGRPREARRVARRRGSRLIVARPLPLSLPAGGRAGGQEPWARRRGRDTRFAASPASSRGAANRGTGGISLAGHRRGARG